MAAMELEAEVPVPVSGEIIATAVEALVVLVPAEQPVAMGEDSVLAEHAVMPADVEELIALAVLLVELLRVLEWDSATIRSSTRGLTVEAVVL